MRVRKTKRAPLPPSSTPLPHEKQEPPKPTIEVSPVVAEWDGEKHAKDEENRSRQNNSSQGYTEEAEEEHPASATTGDKSRQGKWKRKKGPAPARPVPQRRTIRSLPMAEIRRELEMIEMQQQGLERQGVKLEQIIRERTEAADGEMG